MTGGIYCDYKASYVNVYAPGKGKVTFNQTYSIKDHKSTSYGNWVLWTSEDNKITIKLAHLSSFNGVPLEITESHSFPCSGDPKGDGYIPSTTKTLCSKDVVKGELLGVSGMVGNASGPHLHMEIIENGVRKDPIKYLKQW